MPRLRIDHILALSWKFLTPLALVMLVVVALVDKAVQAAGMTSPWSRAGWLFLANVAVALVAAALLYRAERRQQAAREARRFAIVR